MFGTRQSDQAKLRLPPESSQPVLAHLLPSNPNTFFRNFFLSFLLSSFLPRCRPFTPSRFPGGRSSPFGLRTLFFFFWVSLCSFKPVVATSMNQQGGTPLPRGHKFRAESRTYNPREKPGQFLPPNPLQFTRTIGGCTSVQAHSAQAWNSYVRIEG